MPNRSIRATVLATLAALALVAAGATGAEAAAPPLPAKMAALGDSITQAMDSCGYKDCPAYSWATGTQASVASHASRLRAAGDTALVTYNDAVSGSTSTALLGQANSAVSQGADYVTIEIGANDACTSTVAGMTPVATFEANVKSALTAISTGRPGATIFVASIPNLQNLWSVNKSKFGAQLIWSLAKVCQSMLASPTSTKAADVTRRATVQQRVTDFNAALARVCAATSGCRYDNGAVAKYAFTASMISTLDYFHPSYAGQTQLAAITWAAGPYAG